MRTRVYMFGDAPITADEPVLVIDYEYMGERHITVCDFTECGAYVANKTVKWCQKRDIEYTIKQTTIGELIEELPDDLPIDAWNNGKAIWLRERDIKTIGDLRKALHAEQLWEQMSEDERYALMFGLFPARLAKDLSKPEMLALIKKAEEKYGPYHKIC